MLTNPLLSEEVQTLQTQGGGFGYVSSLVSVFITIMLIAGSALFLFMLLAGAILYITSSGDQGRVETAQKTLTFGLIGIIVMFSTYAIVSLVGYIFGVNIISFDLSILILGGATQ